MTRSRNSFTSSISYPRMACLKSLLKMSIGVSRFMLRIPPPNTSAIHFLLYYDTAFSRPVAGKEPARNAKEEEDTSSSRREDGPGSGAISLRGERSGEPHP